MKILYITRKYLPSIGGMQTQSYGFYNALRKEHEVHIIPWGHSQKWLPFFVIIALVRSVYCLIRYKIDIVQLGDMALSPLGVFLMCVFRKKTFAMSHGKDVAYSNRFYQWFVIGSAKKLDGIVCVSSFLKNELIKRGVREDKLAVNTNGIDASKYEDLPDKNYSVKAVENKFDISLQGKKVLLSVSRLVQKKGIAPFVEYIFPKIISEDSNIVLLLVGEATSQEAKAEKQKIIDVSERLGLGKNIAFTGDIKDRDGLLKQVYACSDLYIMPNKHIENDYEGFGIVVLEASINKVPSVAFAVDGITDALADGESGYLVEDGDDDKFARILRELLADEDKRLHLGEKARQYVIRTYDWEIIVKKYDEIIKGLSGDSVT